MARPPSWIVLFAGFVLVACPGRERREPPLPPNLESFDARVVERIQAARAKVQADPGHGGAWAELGMMFASERLKNLALDCYREAARLEPTQPKWPYRQAVTLAQIGETSAAMSAMQRSLELEDSYPPSHARLGLYHLELGELESAEREFRRATVLDSSYPGGWVGLARVALQRDQAAEALALATRLLQTDPEDRTFRQLATLARSQSGEVVRGDEPVLGADEVPVWNDPWELEARAFRQKPDMLRVGKLLQQGHAAEALLLLEGERARGASVSDTALSFAGAYQGLERDADALREIEALLALEPDNTAALVLKAQLLDDGGDLEAAVALLERVTTLQPTHGGAFAAKARKLAQLGQHEAAVPAFQRALELGVNDPELRFSLGQTWIVLKRYPEARPLFEALALERPEHGDTWLELAIARLRTKDLAGADQAFERARATPNASPRLLGDVQRALAAARERREKKSAEDEPR
ncbi:MAG: tetratricopeptide repeat protein [Planctomycetes bacterium]|nr:tetratricopeptide repeat protein [Planctomycetota bacterium]